MSIPRTVSLEKVNEGIAICGDGDRSAAYETAAQGRCWKEYCEYMAERSLSPTTGRKVKKPKKVKK